MKPYWNKILNKLPILKKRSGISFCMLLALVGFMFSCSNNKQKKQLPRDFKSLMGKGGKLWEFIQTSEDRENLDFFYHQFQKSKKYLAEKKKSSIPKTIHYVWVGPNSFPKESIKNVESFIEKHPGWTFKFWTDRPRPLPHSKMELRLVQNFQFLSLGKFFIESDNYAEQADLLRYEILYQEGGLYVDHDVECHKSFAPIHEKLDLYCGIEPPHAPVLSSSISVCNNIIGSVPKHPIIFNCMNLITDRWQKIGKAFPGKDKESVVYRVAYRTFSPFDESLRSQMSQHNLKDMVFPAGYFNNINESPGLYAHHFYASTWFSDETKFEKNVRRRLMSISKKNNQILLINGVILSFNLILLSSLFFHNRSLRKNQDKHLKKL